MNIRAIGAKIWEWLASAQSAKSIHRTNLVLCSTLVVIVLGIFYHLGFFSPDPAPIQPGEIDMSGTWKIQYSDNATFADPKLNDKSWCLIGVPDPNINIVKAEGDKPSTTCPTEKYPAEKMRNNTYWYRKWVEIKPGQSWKEPSIFLGAIKHKAWIYWDGELIGIKNHKDGTGMQNVILDSKKITNGKHLLAVKAESQNTQYPGIFHAFSRKVALGELANNQNQFSKIIREKFILPHLVLFIQTTCLLILLILLVKGKGTSSDFYWLSIYYASNIYSTASATTQAFNNAISWKISSIFTSVAIAGLIVENVNLFSNKKIWTALLTTFACISALFVNFLISHARHNEAENLSLAFYIFPILLWLTSLALKKESKTSNFKNSGAMLIALILNQTYLIIFNLTDYMPIVISHSIFNSITNLAIIYLTIDIYTKQERSLAFFGRFIRPGLRSLLQKNMEDKGYNDAKIFRGRKIAIMKIDIVNHTQTTYQMPYGIKRLFQDTWFTMIDQVVADKVFLDKNIGDGSIYCFSENEKKGTCNIALEAALTIRDESIRLFDEEFYVRLQTLLELTPELKAPAEEFFSKYKERTGVNFLERVTQVRIALVYGFVDEGLWGLTGQSHYDVQGDLVSLVARIESKAEVSEILLDESFGKELGELKLKRLGATKKLVELKGIGSTEVLCLNTKNLNLKKIA